MMSMMPAMLQPPPTAEELALKEQVTQVLASQGVLAKLKAELRAAVFQVMQEREGVVENTRTYAPNAPKLSDFPEETGATALALIVECLQFFKWDHALGVLLAETSAESESQDSAVLANKLGLGSSIPSAKPALFQLIESRQLGGIPSAASIRPVVTTKHDQFDKDGDDDEEEGNKEKEEDEERATDNRPTIEAKKHEDDVRPPVVSKLKKTEEEAKTNDVESSAEIEESMAEEVPSGSELEESNFADGDQEEEDTSYRSGSDRQQPSTLYPTELQNRFKINEAEAEDSASEGGRTNEDEDAVSLAAPPPAPAKLPSLPPLVSAPSRALTGDGEDDFDAELEAERLRKLDAALQAMEAEDDTGTLQQLKASLRMELQEQDSFESSGGIDREEEDDDDAEAGASKADKDEGDDDGYGSSDFEEDEEISEISEEMESMPELSDKEDNSEDCAVASQADVDPPRVLKNDTRVDSEDALNSYDYIEAVDKHGW